MCVLFLGYASTLQAQAPDCDAILAAALQQCQLTAVNDGGKCALAAAGGGGPPSSDSLRCLADMMAAAEECEEAMATLNGIPVVWRKQTALGEGDCQIVIATNVGGGAPAVAASNGSNSSSYASGGTEKGNSAVAIAVGDNGCATATGGHATPGFGGPGGSATAIAETPAVAPGDGDGSGPDGKGKSVVIRNGG